MDTRVKDNMHDHMQDKESEMVAEDDLIAWFARHNSPQNYIDPHFVVN